MEDISNKIPISVKINGELKTTFLLSPGDCITLTKDTDNVAQYTVPRVTHFHYFISGPDTVKRLCTDKESYNNLYKYSATKKVLGLAKWCKHYKRGEWQDVDNALPSLF